MSDNNLRVTWIECELRNCKLGFACIRPVVAYRKYFNRYLYPCYINMQDDSAFIALYGTDT